MPCPQRIWVLGCSGAGKSTLTRQLGARCNLPLVHLDQLFWQSGWQPSADGPFANRVHAATKQARWIMDGGYITALGGLYGPQTELFVQFDLPRVVCMARIFKRIILSYGQVRPDMAAGCPERFDAEFIRYVWTYNQRVKPRIDAMLAQRRADQELFVIRGADDIVSLQNRLTST